MLNNSPWLWNARKTMAGTTARTSRGQRILQGKRAKGQSNPSSAFIQAQQVAFYIAAWWHPIQYLLRIGFTNKPTGATSYSQFMKYGYRDAFDLSAPGVATPVMADLLISQGVMTQTDITAGATAVASTGLVVLSWPTGAVDDSQNVNDKMLVVVANAATYSMIASSEVTDRASGTYTVHCPIGSFNSGDPIVVYLGAVADAGEPNMGTSSPSTTAAITAT